jgi:hypothetical protein
MNSSSISKDYNTTLLNLTATPTRTVGVGGDDTITDSCGMRIYNYLKNISRSLMFQAKILRWERPFRAGATNFMTKGLARKVLLT